eukprot:1191943-Prorocentrum_minimum.AAC.2
MGLSTFTVPMSSSTKAKFSHSVPFHRSLSTRRKPLRITASIPQKPFVTEAKKPLPPKSEIKNPNSPSIVNIRGMDRVATKVRASPDAPLKDYLKLCPQFFPNKSMYNIPLGASIVELDDNTFDLVVPKLQFFDIWLLAKATTNHRQVSKHVLLT